MVLSNNTSVRYFELGAGKFRYNPSNKFCGELVAGIGFASIKNSALEFYGSNKVGDVNVNYFKPFIQPSVGISTKLVDFAFTPRIGLVHFTSNPGNVLDSQVKKDLDSFYSDNRKYFRLRTRGYASAGFQTS